ncbi:hypothetical protein AVEN_232021-1, partial [Araneus ventricosus]
VVKPTETSRFPDVQVEDSEPPPETAATSPGACAVDNFRPKDGVDPPEGAHERSGERNYLLQ